MGKDIFLDYEDTEMFLDCFLKSPKKVQQLLMMLFLKNRYYPEFWNDDEIKSPIEQIFVTALEIYCEYENKQKIFLFPQKEVDCNGKKYYLDFEFNAEDYLTYLTFGEEIENKNFKLDIECDGYEFHQKTKEQVQHDNEREYDLKIAGYEVLRFSGTQIFNNPLKCAEDTYNYILKKIKEK